MKEKEYIVKKNYDMGVYMCDLFVGELVRCKDCIHYESDGGVCRIDDMVVDDTDYCSYAERREESEVEE